MSIIVIIFCIVHYVASQGVMFRTGWMKHLGLEAPYMLNVSADPVLYRPVSIPCDPGGKHGHICEYAAAGPLPMTSDNGWGFASNPVTVGHMERSVLYTGTSLGQGTCFQYLDFTYFHTFLFIPSTILVTNATLQVQGMDDGVRLSIFNSRYPFGVMPSNGYLFAGGTTSLSFQSYLVYDSLNRILLTQVDDCIPTSRLQSATVLLNGTLMPVATCFDGIQNGDETAVDSGGACAPENAGMPQSRDCKWSEWGAWGGCSKYCAGGLQYRRRYHVQEAFLGGNPCIGFSEDLRSCNIQPCPGCGDLITDMDGNVYRTIAIGRQCWMRDNLNSSISSNGDLIWNRKCGLNSGGPYSIYNDWCANGAFYTWSDAMANVTDFYPRPTVPVVSGICPGGPMNWRIPSVDDWNALFASLRSFPSKVLQDNENYCTNTACYRLGETGFDALLLGYISPYDNGTLREVDVNYHSYFWTSSRKYPFQATNMGAASDDQIYVMKLSYDQHLVPWKTQSKRDYLSVRCVSDAL